MSQLRRPKVAAQAPAWQAYLVIGHRSVYPAQQIAFSKSSWIFARADLSVGQEKVRLSYGLLRWWSNRQRKRGKRGDDSRP